MSLIETIKNDQFNARKAKESEVKIALLTTLLSEAVMIGKNDGNRETSDAEVVKLIQKFLKSINETKEVLKYSSDGKIKQLNIEKEILESYMPKMATEEELISEINNLKSQGKANIGEIMAGLKSKFGSNFDGKLASSLARK